EFDLLAVAMYPSTKRWDAFMYTVADWLIPDPLDQAMIFKYQPVASTPNEDWTDSFQTAIKWLRSEEKKTYGHNNGRTSRCGRRGGHHDSSRYKVPQPAPLASFIVQPWRAFLTLPRRIAPKNAPRL